LNQLVQFLFAEDLENIDGALQGLGKFPGSGFFLFDDGNVPFLDESFFSILFAPPMHASPIWVYDHFLKAPAGVPLSAHVAFIRPSGLTSAALLHKSSSLALFAFRTITAGGDRGGMKTVLKCPFPPWHDCNTLWHMPPFKDPS